MAAESATRQAEVLAAAAAGAGPGGAGGGAGAGAGGSNGTADAEETELVQDTAAVVDNEMVHRRGKYLALMGKRFPVDLAGVCASRLLVFSIASRLVSLWRFVVGLRWRVDHPWHPYLHQGGGEQWERHRPHSVGCCE